MAVVNRTLVYAALLLAVWAPASFAQQTGMANMIDHIHLAAPEPPTAVAWYQKYFGGETMAEGTDRLLFGETRLIFQTNKTPQPSEASVADSIGFSVADLDETMKALQTAGAKIVTPARALPGLYHAAVIEDPWGTRIDVVQDPEKRGLHHIHLHATDPASALDWYVDKFGGKVSKMKGRVAGIDYGGIWLLAEKGQTAPSQGHAIDHLGFRPINLESVIIGLKAKNVKVLAEPRPLTLAGGVLVHIAFVEGPDAIRIELVQR